MRCDNDNRPPGPDTSRVLPILGRVAADGRVVLRRTATPPADRQDGWPNDPREA